MLFLLEIILKLNTVIMASAVVCHSIKFIRGREIHVKIVRINNWNTCYLCFYDFKKYFEPCSFSFWSFEDMNLINFIKGVLEFLEYVWEWKLKWNMIVSSGVRVIEFLSNCSSEWKKMIIDDVEGFVRILKMAFDGECFFIILKCLEIIVERDELVEHVDFFSACVEWCMSKRCVKKLKGIFEDFVRIFDKCWWIFQLIIKKWNEGGEWSMLIDICNEVLGDLDFYVNLDLRGKETLTRIFDKVWFYYEFVDLIVEFKETD